MSLIPMRLIWASLALCLFRLWPWEATAHSDADTEAAKLLQQAEDLTDIQSSGSHSFRLMARVQLSEKKGQAQEGTYSLLWESPTVWRDETTFQDFSQVRIASGDKLSIVRKPMSLTLGIFQMFKLLDFPRVVRFVPEAKAQKLQEKDRNGLRERTIEIALPGEPSWKKVFLDGASPMPTRVEYKGSHFGYEFKDYVGFHGHQFPRSLLEFDSNKPAIQVLVQDIEDLALDASSFVPPPDAVWMRWCVQPEKARSLELVEKFPHIPLFLRDDPLEQPVIIYGVIGTAGLWHNFTVVKSAGKQVDSYWMNELRQQHFYPAQCGDSPVLQESAMEFRTTA